MTDDKSTKELAQDTTALTIQSILSSIFGLILLQVMLQFLTTEEFGVYSAILFVSVLLNPIGVLGLDYAAARFIPLYRSRNDSFSVKQFVKKSLAISFLSALTWTLILFILGPSLGLFLFHVDTFSGEIQLAAIMTGFAIVGIIFTGFLTGFKRFRVLAYLLAFGHLFRVISSVYFLSIGWGIDSFFIGWMFYHIIVILIGGFVVLSKEISIETVFANISESSSIVRYAVPAMGFGVLSYLSVSLDQFSILLISTTTVLGIYMVAATLVNILLSIFQITVMSVLLPVFSGKSATANLSVMKLISKFIGMLLIPLGFIFASFSHYIIQIVAPGVQYASSEIPFVLLSIGAVFSIFSYLFISRLMANENTIDVLILYFLISVLQLPLVVILTSIIGVDGAALAKLSIQVLFSIILCIRCHRLELVSIESKSVRGGFMTGITILASSVSITWFLGYGISQLFLVLFVDFMCLILGIRYSKMLLSSDIRFWSNFLPKGDKMADIILNNKMIYKILSIDKDGELH